jgi:hypothetical protein
MNNTIKKLLFINSNILKNKLKNKKSIKQYFSIVGGNNKKNLKIEYKDTIYIYEKNHHDNIYILFSTDELDCVTIIIFPDENIAEIHGIGLLAVGVKPDISL